MKKLIRKIQQYFLPFTCILCGIIENGKRDLCRACYNELPWITNPCIRCAVPLETSSFSQNEPICGTCLKNPPYFDKTFALFRYQKPIDKLIIRMKFHHKLLYGKLLGELMAKTLLSLYENDNLPETIIPVPLHRQRLKERGYNQALELVKPIGNTLLIPIDTKLCQRIRYTAPQSLISAATRKKNLKNAFALTKSTYLKHVAIVDDVITTGNTVNELSRTLRAIDIHRIDVWSCAKVIK